jgi:hypothetical protein
MDLKKSRLLLLLLTLSTAGTCIASEQTSSEPDSSDTGSWDFHIGAAAKVSTLGIGLEASVPVIQDQLNVRAGFNTFSYDYEDDSSDGGSQDLSLKADLKLQSIPLLLDWHPFKGGFRLSTGLVLNNNEANGTATCEQAFCEFGDEIFDAATLGTTQVQLDMGGTQPYLGLGYGNAVGSKGGFGFAFDLGVLFQDPTVTITPSASCQADPDCSDQAAQEEAELNDDVKDFDLYPVISFGLSYKFK